jgi:hypothetical protein
VRKEKREALEKCTEALMNVTRYTNLEVDVEDSVLLVLYSHGI